MNKLVACLFVAVVLWSGCVVPAQAQPLDRIAAVVDEDVILQSELDRAVATSSANTPTARTSCRRATSLSDRCSNA